MLPAIAFCNWFLESMPVPCGGGDGFPKRKVPRHRRNCSREYRQNGLEFKNRQATPHSGVHYGGIPRMSILRRMGAGK